MIFRQHDTHPLRMYIESSRESIEALSASLYDKFYYQSPYANEQEEVSEIDQLIFTDEEGNSYFPSGIVSIVKDAAQRLGNNVEVYYSDKYKVVVEDVNVPDDIIDGITLRYYQLDGVKAALIYKRGLIQVPTGGGKSNMMIAVCKMLHASDNFNIIMCVPTTYLLHQTYDNAIAAGVSKKDLCKYGDGNELEPNKRIVIATVQTLYRRLDKEDSVLVKWFENVNCVIFDEVQHVSSMSWYTVADRLQPEYLLGFSAEPFYGDREHMVRDLITRGTLGSILYRASMKELTEKGYLSKPYVIAMNSKYRGRIYDLINWHSVNKSGIVDNILRNDLIVNTSLMLISLNKNPLILVQQIRHGKDLAIKLSSHDKKVAMMTGGSIVTVYSGGMEVDSYKDEEGIVKNQFRNGLLDAIIGTSTLDEGVDMPSLSSVILAGGGKVSIRIIQRVGRGLRVKKGDNTTFIIDFQDRFNVVLAKHFRIRKSTFDKNNIPVYFADTVDQAMYIVNNLKQPSND